MQKVKTAILISGRGSNMKALIEACKDPKFPAQINLVISNKKDAQGLKFAQENNIKTIFINHQDFASREEFDLKLSEAIEQNNCQLICLAGFMRILSAGFVKKWTEKLINIHPSLLPDFKGGNAVRDVINAGVDKSGCTVHFVTEEMDSGPIIKQITVDVLKDDTQETLAARILEKEHLIYPQALKLVSNQILQNQK